MMVPRRWMDLNLSVTRTLLCCLCFMFMLLYNLLFRYQLCYLPRAIQNINDLELLVFSIKNTNMETVWVSGSQSLAYIVVQCPVIKPFWGELHKAIKSIQNINLPLQFFTLFFRKY